MTAEQLRLLDFVDAYICNHGFSPSYEEMAEHLGLRSKSSVHRLASALIERGYLRRESGGGAPRHRDLVVVSRPVTDNPLARFPIDALIAELQRREFA